MIYGERVRQLREMHGWTQTLLAERAGLAQPVLSRIESDLSVPDDELIALLAASLGTVPEFFLREPLEGLAAHSPQLRARNRLTQRDKNSVLAWAGLIDEAYLRVLPELSANDVRLTPLPGIPPEEGARVMRRELGFDQASPLPYLVVAVERLGVRVLGIPVAQNAIDAFCAWRGVQPVMAVLDGVPGDRLRFNVAHELGHLVLHPRRTASKDLEAEADRFAAELLTPRASLEEELPDRPTLSSLTMLKTRWGVSVKALVRRSRELGRIDADRATSFYRQISSRGWNKNEPGYVPREKPRGFRRHLEAALGENRDVAFVARSLDWSTELAEAVLAQHARRDELPFEPRQEAGEMASALPAGVIPLRRA